MAASQIVLIAGLAIVVFGAAVWALRPSATTAENQIAFAGLTVKMNTPALAVMALGVVLVLVSATLQETKDAVYRTSFDCDKARGKVEKWICSDEKLAGLDIMNASLYKQALGRLPPERIEDFVAEKDAFVDERRICQSKACVEQTFLRRIEVLKDKLAELKTP